VFILIELGPLFVVSVDNAGLRTTCEFWEREYFVASKEKATVETVAFGYRFAQEEDTPKRPPCPAKRKET
jgi:hypothetical protein